MITETTHTSSTTKTTSTIEEENDIESYNIDINNKDIPSSHDRKKRRKSFNIILNKILPRSCKKNNSKGKEKQEVILISGIYDVLYGSKPACECIKFYNDTYQLPRYAW